MIPGFDPFAELNQIQRTQCRNGIPYNDLGLMCWNVYNRINGVRPIPELKEADLPPWECVAGKAASIIDLPEDEQAALEVSAKALAKTLYNQYTIECDKVPEWESVAHKAKVSWEAVGRHMANIIDSDGTGLDFQEMEDRVVMWAEDRLLPAQLQMA